MSPSGSENFEIANKSKDIDLFQEANRLTQARLTRGSVIPQSAPPCLATVTRLHCYCLQY
jgi:hypothetical protein